MTIQKIIFLAFLFSYTTTSAQYPTFRLHPTDTNQIEPSIVVHPSNPQILFSSAFTILGATLREGIYVTTNGGQTWNGIDRILGDQPIYHGGDPGPLIDKNGRFILTHRANEAGGWWCNYSNDNGSTWSAAIPIYSFPEDVDKGSASTDQEPVSTYYGRSYLVWTKFASPFPILMSYSSNGGANWSSNIQINSSPSGHISVGPSVTVGITGQVYVCWASQVINGVEDFIGFGISSNGGSNWTVYNNAFDVNGIKTQQFSPWTIRANGYPSIDVDRTGGPRNGWIYIATTEKNLAPAGSDPDIIFHRSTNGGANWSQGFRVNQDLLNNGKIQFFPAINVDNDGGINIVYYDNRNGTDSVEVFISRSVNGGNTWTDYLISDHKFMPAPVVGTGGNMGDNIGITSSNGKLYPVWMDNKVNPGFLQILTAVINYNTIGVKSIGSAIPKNFVLSQNYPNPFNPSTKFRFDVPPSISSQPVKLTVYNILGKQVASLFEGQISAGTYEATFDGTNLPSGVYYCRLSANDFSQTKAMVLLK